MLGDRKLEVRLVKADKPETPTDKTEEDVLDKMLVVIDYASTKVIAGIGLIIAMQTLSKIIVKRF